MTGELDYPEGAYRPMDNKLWWDREKGDGPKGADGALPRAASWLRWNVEIDGTFTTAELRRALNINQEHFQRRLRELSDWGWKYVSSKEIPELGEARKLKAFGWWPGSSERRPVKQGISETLRRRVIERDGRQCQICGMGIGDTYPDGTRVTLTAGHIRANSHGGDAQIDNLRSECRRCNEAARADTGSPTDPMAMVERVKGLSYKDRKALLEWMTAGRRYRSDAEIVYGEVMVGGPAVQNAVREYLQEIIPN